MKQTHETVLLISGTKDSNISKVQFKELSEWELNRFESLPYIMTILVRYKIRKRRYFILYIEIKDLKEQYFQELKNKERCK